MLSEEKKIVVHNILYKYCSDFLNVQEITHAANEIVKNPTERTILDTINYLDSFDTMRNGSQSQLQPQSNVQAFTANNVRFAMSEIRKLLSSEEELDNSLFTGVIKAPLHDVSGTITDENLVSNYTVSVGVVKKSDGLNIIPVTFTGENLKKHTNGANVQGYWMGIGIPDSVMPVGYTVSFARGFGKTYDINNLEFDSLSSDFFEEDSNISSIGKYCSFYREVGQAKENSNHAFVIFKLTKQDTDPLYYVYDYNYTNVTLSE